MMKSLDDYYDLLTLLGRMSYLVETYYYDLTEEEIQQINVYVETILFHINERSERKLILRELADSTMCISDFIGKK
jgi:hypothetical protein